MRVYPLLLMSSICAANALIYRMPELNLSLSVSNASIANSVIQCHTNCTTAGQTPVHVQELVPERDFAYFEVVYPTNDRGNPKFDVEEYSMCLGLCLEVPEPMYRVYVTGDIFYMSGREYSEIQETLDFMGSTLPPDYQYMGSDCDEEGCQYYDSYY